MVIVFDYSVLFSFVLFELLHNHKHHLQNRLRSRLGRVPRNLPGLGRVVLRLTSHLIDVLKGKTTLGKKRSPQWPKVRAEHLRKCKFCMVCGGTKKLEVHHIKPFHLDPSLELEPTNLITLCEAKKRGINCHLLVGHLGNYRQENPQVLDHAQFLNAALATKSLKD